MGFPAFVVINGQIFALPYSKKNHLSEIYFERLDYKKAWNHFIKAKELLKKQNYYPKELKKLYQKLKTQSPEI